MRRRHLFCPDCGYDVSGQVEARRMRCSECGLEFEEGDLLLERRPGDWTPWRGLARAGRALTFRSAVFVPAWAFLVCWAVPLIDSAMALRPLLVLLLVGIGVGLVYSRGVVDQAGFVSGLVTALAAAACLVALGAAVGIAAAIRPMSPWGVSITIGAPWLSATLTIVKLTLLDE